MFTSMWQNGLVVLVAPRTFSKRTEEMSKEELKVCFYTSTKKKDARITKVRIHKILRSPPHNKPFSIISHPAFTEANKVLDAFVKDLRKTGKIAGVIHKKAIWKEQLNKLFESGELGPADNLNPAQLQKTVGFYLGLFFGRRGRENQRQCFLYGKLHKGLNTTNWTEVTLVPYRLQKIIRAASAGQSLTNFHIKSLGKQFLSKIILQPVQHLFHGMAIRGAFPSIFTTVV